MHDYVKNTLEGLLGQSRPDLWCPWNSLYWVLTFSNRRIIIK